MSELYILNSNTEVRIKGNNLYTIDRIKDHVNEFEVNDETIMMFKLLVNPNTVEELYLNLKEKYNNTTLEEVSEIINILYSLDIVKTHVTEIFKLNNLHNDIFSRQILYWEQYTKTFDDAISIQKTVGNSRVMIIGLGGVGTWMLQYLLQSGIKKFILVDDDKIELSNLNRQVFFKKNKVGLPKVKVIQEYLKEENGDDIEVVWINEKITSSFKMERIMSNLEELPDVVVSCADEPNVSTVADWITESCMPRRIMHQVAGGYNGHLGLIGPSVIPYKTSCWNCYKKNYKEDPAWVFADTLVPAKISSPSLGLLSSLIANIQSLEVIRMLTNFEKTFFSDKISEINPSNMKITSKFFYRDPTCRFCKRENN